MIDEEIEEDLRHFNRYFGSYESRWRADGEASMKSRRAMVACAVYHTVASFQVTINLCYVDLAGPSSILVSLIKEVGAELIDSVPCNSARRKGRNVVGLFKSFLLNSMKPLLARMRPSFATQSPL